ncbi:uncharacterized protein LOC134578547 [Pelobates fuscus]|uniref:uncharacterized protein LOC134578547 n=1 Tax=Pelobates fuscus TaxID=191477 RepID=UPI002FE489DA
MAKCLVIGCSSNQTNTDVHISFHRFPKSAEKVRAWLQATGDQFNNIEMVIQLILQRFESTTMRICSEHFTPDCYSFIGLKFRKLHPGAIPTIFKKNTLRDRVLNLPKEILNLSGNRYLRVYTIHQQNTEKHCSRTTTGEDSPIVLGHNYSSEIGYTIPTISNFTNHGMNTEKMTLDKAVSICKIATRSIGTQTKCTNRSVSVATSTIGLLKSKDVGTWTGPHEYCEEINKSENEKSLDTEVIELETSQLNDDEIMEFSESSPYQSPKKRTTIFMTPSSQSSFFESPMLQSTISSGNDAETSDLAENQGYESSAEYFVIENKFIIFESCLDELLKSFAKCNNEEYCDSKIIRIEKKIQGTLLIIYTECEQKHTCLLWRSQPMINKRSVGNLLASAALLFSGSHFAKVSEFFKMLKVPFISESLHYRFQNTFLFPIINLYHKKDRDATLDNFKGTAVCLSGDAQCDSPGFCAKYCTYTLIEEETQKIVECNVIQVSEATSSVTMESKAFRRSVDTLLADGVKIGILATDRHIGIRKIMRENYPFIIHQFDVWHFCKSMTNKLNSLTRQQMYKELSPWKTSIINHMWASCSLCKGNVSLLKERWESILHHIINEHSWENDGREISCDHLPILETERPRRWLRKDTSVYSRFSSFVTDPKLLKDLDHLNHFCHTGNLEDYHSMILKYRPKRVHFSMDGMIARTKLAVLAHNANVDRKQAIVFRSHKGSGEVGSLRYRPACPKKTKNWRANKIHEPVFIDHLFQMMADVLKLSMEDLETSWESQNKLLPANIDSIPRPQTKELAAKHISRFEPKIQYT